MDATVVSPAPPSLTPFEVLDACHRQILQTLARLARLPEHLERCGADPAAQAQARRAHAFFSGTARQHHLDEEEHVFPRLLESGDEALVRAVSRLRQDHGWLEENWIELAPRLAALAGGYGGYDPDELRHAIEVFTALYREHIRLEESRVYPEARARLNRLQLDGMGREMAARQRREHLDRATRPGA